MSILEITKALADETRLRIVSLVLEAGDVCSCEIESILNITQSNASRHLTRLRWAGILSSYKKAQWIHYLPAQDVWDTYPCIQAIIDSSRKELPFLQDDLALLSEYRESGETCTTIKKWDRFVSK